MNLTKQAILLGLISLMISTSQLALAQYKVSIDLTATEDDYLPVEIDLPPIVQDTIEYQMPKIVPGTYSVYDFGRFVSSFSCLDSAGQELPVSRLTDNRWQIANASQAKTIRYRVEDTRDTKKDNFVFEPGGTSFEYEAQVHMLNTHGIIGYLSSMKQTPYELTFIKPEGLFGATSLKATSRNTTTDVFAAPTYAELADAPIMYSQPDTITKVIGGAEVLVSVYSPEGKLSAEFVMDEIYPILEAQKEYLGGTLPVDRYAFLIYLFNGPSGSGGYGALEHSYSSLYFLPERNPDEIAQTVRDVAAHEFFHIVTPLNIHSEEIGNFDFIEPQMSEHLWLYEGVTEYSAMHVQVKYGLMDRESFLAVVKEKLDVRDRFPTDLPFTEMSKKVLGEYEDYYGNVYYKGALIGMCLDLKLLSLSDGQYDLQQLLRDLAKEYGNDKSFKDEELFGKIESLTYPEIGEFLRTYVSGDQPLPIEEILALAGVSYLPEQKEQTITLGNISLNLTDEEELYIYDVSEMNSFGIDMGYQQGDILLSLQGEDITLESIEQVFNNYKTKTEAGDKVKMVVRREVNGKQKEIKLKGKASTVSSTVNHIMEYNAEASEQQLKIREAWLSAQ